MLRRPLALFGFACSLVAPLYAASTQDVSHPRAEYMIGTPTRVAAVRLDRGDNVPAKFIDAKNSLLAAALNRPTQTIGSFDGPEPFVFGFVADVALDESETLYAL